jgi:hypothetical protein
LNPDVFAEWLRGQGRSVVRTNSSYWVDFGARTYQAFPYHLLIQPSEEELDELLRKSFAVGARYSTQQDATLGIESYHAVFEGLSYEMNNLGKWARKNVRRGLKNCVAGSTSFSDLATSGWRLQQETLQRQGRRTSFTEKDWKHMCFAAQDLPGFDAWGAFTHDGNELAASVITFQMEDCVYMLYQQSRTDLLKLHANNALAFEVTKAVLERPMTRKILYGLHSLDAPPGVDEFKFRMGYWKKPVKQRVKFNRLLAPFVNKFTHSVVKKIQVVCPSNYYISKAEGMFRFYME